MEHTKPGPTRGKLVRLVEADPTATAKAYAAELHTSRQRVTDLLKKLGYRRVWARAENVSRPGGETANGSPTPSHTTT